jgi:hypothetical protein
MGETVTLNTHENAQPVESKEYQQQMLDKATQASNPTVDTKTDTPIATEQKPQEKILGKFNSQDDLIKSYQELEKKLGEKSKPTDTKQNNLQADKPAAVQSLFNFDQAEKEFNETGNVSEETLSALEKVGLSKNYINNYISGLKALATQFEAKAYDTTGGQENYTKMTAWVASNLSAAEVERFNSGVASDDETALYTIKGMYARYNLETKEPNLRMGETGTQSAGEVYESVSQMKSDMKNPKYDSDPAFRKMVENKLSRSKIF